MDTVEERRRLIASMPLSNFTSRRSYEEMLRQKALDRLPFKPGLQNYLRQIPIGRVSFGLPYAGIYKGREGKIGVKYVPRFMGREEIEKTMGHELTHAAIDKLKKNLRKGEVKKLTRDVLDTLEMHGYMLPAPEEDTFPTEKEMTLRPGRYTPYMKRPYSQPMWTTEKIIEKMLDYPKTYPRSKWKAEFPAIESEHYEKGQPVVSEYLKGVLR